MNQPTLAQLHEFLSANTQEVEGIKLDVANAKAILESCDERLKKLVGGQEDSQQKPLRFFIRSVLNNSNEPLTVKEITEFVLEAGYKTSSKNNFRNIVQQTILGDSEFKRATKPKIRPARYTVEEV